MQQMCETESYRACHIPTTINGHFSVGKPEACGSATGNADGNFPMPFNGTCKKIMEMQTWYLG